MYDSIYPAFTAQIGTALELEGLLMQRHAKVMMFTPSIQHALLWSANYTSAYIHSLVTKDAMGSQLLSYHNLAYMMRV